MNRINIYGVGVDRITAADAVNWADRTIADNGRGRIVTLNTTGLMVAETDPFFKGYVDEAELVVADGQPLVWASKLSADPLAERVPGIDLVNDLAARAADRGWSLFLLGSEEETIEDAANVLENRHPGLKIAGHHHGFLGDRTTEVAARIGRSGASILLVGMGSPRQERFIAQHWEELGVNVAVGVGGTFEVIAGRLRRAPALVQRIGLEWAFRMMQEPGRLVMRYASTMLWLTRRTPRAAYNRLRMRMSAVRSTTSSSS